MTQARHAMVRRPGLAVLCVLALLAGAAATLFLLDRLFPPPVEALRKPASRVVLDRHGEGLRMLLAEDDRWRFPVALDEVAPVLREVVVELEDRRFFRHPGFDPIAIARAAWSNLRAGRVVSGASTISMQLARLAEPKPRTLWSKCVELLRAVQLERRFTKRELLEMYLNNAPYGSNIEGVAAAAYFYFGKDPGRLSSGESALLAVLPRAPVAYDPTLHHAAARRVRDRVLQQLERRGVLTAEQADAARREPLPERRRSAPMRAPHLTTELARRDPGPRIHTTLDAAMQESARRLLAGRHAALRGKGIEQAAVVVIEIESRSVRALVGSADFFDDRRHGQVNGARARRSPGSTLKPFLYALAFDRGEIVPDSYLLDVPTSFGGYVAENYDDRYRGRVTARTALARSLNAPAVRLLARVGLERFHTLLRRGGLTTLDRPAAEYGLPLVLGAGEVTLLDLTNLFATLASGGEHRPVRLRPGDSGAATSLFSSEAGRMVTGILMEVRRPDLPRSWSQTRDAPAVAWKTGTSYGHRDAWAVGYSGRHAIGVWVGSFDGGSQRGISGSEHAAPLLFDLFRAFEKNGAQPDAWKSGRHAEIEVCAVSRQRPGPGCEERMHIAHIPGRTHLPVCEMHRRMFVHAESGEELIGSCIAERPHRAVVATIFPPPLVAWWRSTGHSVPEPPPPSPHCAPVGAGRGLRIVSPGDGAEYVLRAGVPEGHQRISLAAQGSRSGSLYWFHDGRMIEQETDGKRSVPLRPGLHRVVVVDAAGRTDGATYRVATR